MRNGTVTPAMVLLVVASVVGCGRDEVDRERCGEGASCDTEPAETPTESGPESANATQILSCEPVPRFRHEGIEYENQRFDDWVAEADLGPVVGLIVSVPPAVARCEIVELSDGEGTWPAGTQIHEISGVIPTTALAASLGNGVYLRFEAKP